MSTDPTDPDPDPLAYDGPWVDGIDDPQAPPPIGDAIVTPPYAWPRSTGDWRRAVLDARHRARDISSRVGPFRARWGTEGYLERLHVVDPDHHDYVPDELHPIAGPAVATLGVTLALLLTDGLPLELRIAAVAFIIATAFAAPALLAGPTREIAASIADVDEVPDLLLASHTDLRKIAAAHDDDGGILDRAVDHDHRLIWALAGDQSPAQARATLRAHMALVELAEDIDEQLVATNPGTPASDALERLRVELDAINASQAELAA